MGSEIARFEEQLSVQYGNAVMMKGIKLDTYKNDHHKMTNA